MHVPTIGFQARLGATNNWTTSYVPTPESYYASPDTRAALATVEPVDTNSSVYTPAPVQGYDTEAHQRLANYANTSLENTSIEIEGQNNFINDLFNTLSGSVT